MEQRTQAAVVPQLGRLVSIEICPTAHCIFFGCGENEVAEFVPREGRVAIKVVRSRGSEKNGKSSADWNSPQRGGGALRSLSSLLCSSRTPDGRQHTSAYLFIPSDAPLLLRTLDSTLAYRVIRTP